MKQYIEIRCRYCGADDLVKNGRSENGTRRYRRGECRKSFQHRYTYNASKPGMTNQIERRTLNSSGIGYTGENINISGNIVFSELKKAPAEMSPYFTPEVDGYVFDRNQG